MTAILDQKHYIEELNRHLSCTVTDLQVKMDSLEKTNSKLVEEVRRDVCVCVNKLCGCCKGRGCCIGALVLFTDGCVHFCLSADSGN